MKIQWSGGISGHMITERSQLMPADRSRISVSAYRLLSRLAVYVVLLAWIILGLDLYLVFQIERPDSGIVGYFLSLEHYGIKFHTLVLLAPFILSVLSYLINDRAQLFRKALLAEKELRQKTIELEKVNELLTRENSARKKAEEQLTRHAFYDTLTNLPNRALFVDHVHNALERQKAVGGAAFAVLFLDVDRFKVINDGLGHVAGDQFLIMFSQRLRELVSPGDTVAHFGGDAFALLMEDARELWYVENLVDRIKDEMRSAFQLSGHEVFASASIGIVLSNKEKYGQPEELIRDAEIAMHHAKARGKACHVIFDPAMHAEATSILWLETELRRGLEQNELTVYYQPVISIEDDTIIGFEALVRWRHPDRGLMLPLDFTTVAEETGLIIPLSYRLIHEACWQMQQWQSQFPGHRNLTVSITISNKVFSQPDFGEIIEKILYESGIGKGSLRLEIAERMLMETPEPAAVLMKQLKDLHVCFDIGDFGIGYSALNYLRHFPFDGLKIAPSFIKALPYDNNNAEIVKTMVALAKALNLEVIAQGIETPQQLEIFKSMNGKYAQGPFFFPPMESKAAEELLTARQVIR